MAVQGFLNTLVIITLVLSIVSLFLEQAELTQPAILILIQVIDFLLTALIITELVVDISSAPYMSGYIRRNLFSIGFLGLYIVLFIYNKYLYFAGIQDNQGFNAAVIIVVRNFFLVFKVFGRIRRISTFLNNLTVHPAQTLVLSFIMVILTGTFYLMLPFTTRDGLGLNFIDALFTTTSAVCVTGLIVVDTASHFTVLGQVGILVLIQIGGLGIMILSYFAIVTLRRSIGIHDKVLLAYMINEDDMRQIAGGLRKIILLTFGIELVGALILFLGFIIHGLPTGQSIWFGVFHAISAFCNAGFALFTDSLEGFRHSLLISGGIALLIILGGLSFAVMTNLIRWSGLSKIRERLTLNSRVVLVMTGVLILLGMVVFYALEHGSVMAEYNLGEQYLAAFFQSVTLRTAGFNTVPMAPLGPSVTLIMIIWMFIGGASGSTAGGIKVNTAAVILAYIRSRFRGEEQVLIGGAAIDSRTGTNALLLFVFGIVAVLGGLLVLLITESGPFLDLLFETVSAFGTVGLSRGITGDLTDPGRVVVSLLMFMGRLGPLTLLTALGTRVNPSRIIYPEKELMIG